MNKFFLISVAVLGVICYLIYQWLYVAPNSDHKYYESTEAITTDALSVNELNSETTSPFSCDGRQYCSQMKSHAEAMFFMNNCPDTKMDENKNGFPCDDPVQKDTKDSGKKRKEVIIIYSKRKIRNVINKNRKFKCDGRQYCSQMNSYEEAVYFLNNCPNPKMDGDGDGIPCERQFGR